jgi:alpha-glucosidase
VTSLHWTAGLHHDGSALYVGNQAPKIGDQVTIKLRTPATAPIERVILRTAPDGENHTELMHKIADDGHLVWWGVEMPIHMPLTPYRFKVMTTEGAYYYTHAGVSRTDGPEWTDFKLVASFTAPSWAHSAVFYQIFPDRFFNGDPSNDVPEGAWELRGFKTHRRSWGAPVLAWKEAGNLDYYGGDLQGITQKLPYLLDLGVNALYLNPIFTAHSNHRYDVSDFHSIDPYVGGNDGLALLRRETEAVGVKIMLDVTLNHCGWKNGWFTAAQADRHAPTAEYFTFHEHPHRYESWLGVRSLPKLNYRSQKLRDHLFRAPDSVLRTWMRPPYRVDGWRLDVANMQGRQGAYQVPHEIGREIRQAVKAERTDAYLIGEHFYDATTYLQGDELDATMNYAGFTLPLWRWLCGHDLGLEWKPEIADAQLLGGEELAEQWTRFRAPLPWQVARVQFNLLDSHDTSRLLHKLHGDKTLLRLALALLMAYPGTPSLYYGTEIGMTGGTDPDNRRCMPWEAEAWDHDLREYVKRLVRLRRTAPALIDGGFQHLYAVDGVVAFQRQSAEQRLIVVGQRGPNALALQLIPVWHGGLKEGATLVDMIGGGMYPVEGGMIRLSNVPKGTALILEERG